MVNIIIMAHSEIADSFVRCAEHILSRKINKLHILEVKKTDDVTHIINKAKDLIQKIGHEFEILILTDLFGATPSNIAKDLLIPNKVELITGLNLPMLIRAITYSDKALHECVKKAVTGAISGIMHLDH